MKLKHLLVVAFVCGAYCLVEAGNYKQIDLSKLATRPRRDVGNAEYRIKGIKIKMQHQQRDGELYWGYRISSIVNDSLMYSFHDWPSELMIINPIIYSNSDTSTFLLLFEHAMEYSLGHDVYLMKNGKMTHCGFLNLIANNDQESSIFRYAAIHDSLGQIVVNFKNVKVYNQDDEAIEYSGQKLSLKIDSNSLTATYGGKVIVVLDKPKKHSK